MAKAAKVKGENLAGIFDEVKSMGGLLDPCRAKLKVITVAKDHDQNNLRRYNIQSQIRLPKGIAGGTHFENFRVGIASDPDALKASTWTNPENWGARAMRTFLENTKMVPGFEKKAPEEALKLCQGKTFGCQFGVKIDNRKKNKDGSDNQYFGSEQQTRKFFADDGSKKYEMLGAKRPLEAEEDDESAEEAEEPPKKPKGKKPPVEEDTDETEDDEEDEPDETDDDDESDESDDDEDED